MNGIAITEYAFISIVKSNQRKRNKQIVQTIICITSICWLAWKMRSMQENKHCKYKQRAY